MSKKPIPKPEPPKDSSRYADFYREAADSQAGAEGADVTLADLSKLVEPDHCGLGKPFRVDQDGVIWEVASNRVALSAQVNAAAEIVQEAPTKDVLTMLAAQPGDFRRVSLAALRAWAEAPFPCPQCDGSGSKPCGCEPTEQTGRRLAACNQCYGRGKCNQCSWYQEHDCGACFGMGKVGCDDCEAGVAACVACRMLTTHLTEKVLLDRRVLARYLAPFTGDESVKVEVGEELSMVRILGSMWRVFVMPIKGDAFTKLRGDAFVWPESAP